MYQKLSDKEEWVAKEIVDIAVNIHIQLGPNVFSRTVDEGWN